MRIKSLHLTKFKRFTDLTILDIPETTKLVILIGPNGSGKTSLFDAFKSWHLNRGFGGIYNKDYCNKDSNDQSWPANRVNIDFYGDSSFINNRDTRTRELFYFRTAYRNSPKINVNSLQEMQSPLDRQDNTLMCENSSTMDEDYQRLVSTTVQKIFDPNNDNKTVGDIRKELFSKLGKSINNLFPDLTLSRIGIIPDTADFYFNKGTTKDFEYEKLSGGEKAAFDLLFDILVKSEYYQDTIFCIDEPETHIHTKLQADLLKELYSLMNEKGQLWIATHSFGMMKQAKALAEENPGTVTFLNFDGYDFDTSVTITPEPIDLVIWNKMVEISFDDYASFLMPEVVVFCEGTSKGRTRKDFDARCYSNIFSERSPKTVFYSLGNCNDIEERDIIVRFIETISPKAKVIRLVDCDNRSADEVQDLQDKGVKVLPKRNIESYLLDDEVLKKLCEVNNHANMVQDVLAIKTQAINDSKARGNAEDDLKSARGDLYTKTVSLLNLTQAGNNADSFIRDTLCRLIKPDMAVYKELEHDIFGD